MNPNEIPSEKKRASWLQRFVFALVALATFVVLFYAEENWRGKRAWENYQRERLAAGEHLPTDLAWYMPKPVPDDQNFYKTPLLESIGYGKGFSPRGAATAQVGERMHQLNIFGSALGTFEPGAEHAKRSNLILAQQILRTNAYFNLPPSTEEPAAEVASALDQPAELNELRQASLRPYSLCRACLPVSEEIPNFQHLRGFTQTFAISAIAQLAVNNPEKARRDERVLEQIVNALHGNQTLISAMIRVAIAGVNTQVFWEGWADGKWQDKQLEELQKFFASTDLLSDVDRSFRTSERHGIEDIIERPRQEIIKAFAPSHPDFGDHVFNWAVRLAPQGWLYQNLLVQHQMGDKWVCPMSDPANMRVFPEKTRDYERELSHFRGGFFHPFHFLTLAALPNYSRAYLRAAQTQAYMHEAAIVCALERFRHVNGHYPGALDELTPKFIDVLPHDVIGGEPYHYRTTDQGFLLYSIGWNEKDDGGKPGNEPAGSDMKTGDWAWRYPQAN